MVDIINTNTDTDRNTNANVVQILVDAQTHENPELQGSLTAVCVQQCFFLLIATLFNSHLMTKQDNRTNLREKKSSRDLHNYLPVTLTVHSTDRNVNVFQ